MSSGPLPWPLLNSFLLLATLAGQPSTASLPTALASAIPDCAQSCVESFIANEFPTSVCSTPQDLDCLCTKTGKSGFTLGEGSLRCVVTTCVGVGDSEGTQFEYQGRVEAYTICAGIPNANPMTHGTLTATRSPTPTVSISSTRTTRKSSSSSRRSRTNTLSSRSRTRSSTLVPAPTSDTTSTTALTTKSTGSVTSQSAGLRSSTSSSLSSLLKTTHSSTIASSSPTSSFSTIPPTSSATEPASALSKGKLSNGKIAGIAFGALFAALAFAVIIFFICRNRRRRSNRRDSGSTFGGDDLLANYPSSPGLYHRVGGEPEPNYISRQFTQLEGQEGQITPIGANRSSPNPWRNSVQPTSTPGRTIRQVMAESPMSSKRSRTPSTLLPDKPALYSLYPAPLRVNHSVSPESPGGGVVPGAAGIGQRSAMGLSKASPRGRISPDTSQVSPQRDSSDPQPSASDPFVDPRSDPTLAMYGRQRSQNPRSEVLTYGRPNPEVLNHGPWTQSLDNLRKPVPARQSSSARSLTRQKAAKASISPSDYTGRQMFDFPPNPITIPRKPVPIRKSAPRRSATHYSSASDTSFEDAGCEDAIPTANAIPPPVEESRAMRSNQRQATSPNVSWSLPSPSESRPDPGSPTRKPPRRKQPPPIVTSAAASRPLKSSLKPLKSSLKPLKSSLKPLPRVPEIPDSSTPLIPKMRGNQVPAPIATDSRDSPRVETELTAKWKILIGPGLQPIENTGTPRSGRSSEWTPNTPTRRDA
ncbi:hypothetical protein MMC22_008054 [Lobaria immixta]|nr:hypothetical protein [Lobaria immixta]